MTLTAYERRDFKPLAAEAKLTSKLTAAGLTITVSSVSGWSDAVSKPFLVVVDAGKSTQEIVRVPVGGLTGTTITLANLGDRGLGGTVAVEHQNGATIQPMWTNIDADEASQAVAVVFGAKAEGALGDGVTDDTVALAAWLATDGDKFLPAGTYRISDQLAVLSNTHIRMAADAIIKPLSSFTGLGIFRMTDQDNITIEGGVLDGDKANNVNKGTYGIMIMGSTNVTIRGVVAKNFPGTDSTGTNGGDGFYLGRSAGGAVPSNILFEGVTADANVRQGLSIVAGKNVRCVGCTFANTSGSNPGAGIDIEPDDTALDLIQDIVIESCHILNNDKGIQVASTIQATSDITIANCTIRTTRSTTIGYGVYGPTKGNVTVIGGSIKDTKCSGVRIQNTSGSFQVIGVHFENPTVTRSAGMYPVYVHGNAVNWSVVGNKIILSATDPVIGIDVVTSSRGLIANNLIDCAGQTVDAIQTDNCSDITITGNMLRNSGTPASTRGIQVQRSASAGTGHIISGNRIIGFAVGILLNTNTSANRCGPNDCTGCTATVTNTPGAPNFVFQSKAMTVQTWAATNATVSRSFDADACTVAELADVVATLLLDLTVNNPINYNGNY